MRTRTHDGRAVCARVCVGIIEVYNFKCVVSWCQLFRGNFAL